MWLCPNTFLFFYKTGGMLDLAHELWFPDPGLEQCYSFPQYSGLMHLEEKNEQNTGLQTRKSDVSFNHLSFADNVILGALYFCV